MRWEREYGWTRFGGGSIAEQETSITEVLDRMLTAHDHRAGFAAAYLDALDAAERDDAAPVHTSTWSFDPDRERRERTRALARWHAVLIDRLVDSDTDDLLDRLVLHPGLDGPELTFVRARLAHARGDDDRARQLVHDCLEERPGHRGFHAFARGIDAPLPSRAQGLV